MKRQTSIAIILLFLSFSYTFAGNPFQQSEKMKPDWLINKLPKPRNSSFFYQIVQCDSDDLNKARKGCIEGLVDYIEQTNDIRVEGSLTSTSASKTDSKGTNENISREYVYRYKIESKEFSIHFRKSDEYWETLTNANEKRVYRCYILYAVGRPGSEVHFDNITFSYKYGVDALWRSALVPGYGQLHKGHKAKGICIMGGEAALAGGIIFFESQNRSYRRKVNETLDGAKRISYTDKADNCQTARNICIGGAAALYIYNVIDAIATDGRKRTITNKSLNIYPAITSGYNGVSLSLNF